MSTGVRYVVNNGQNPVNIVCENLYSISKNKLYFLTKLDKTGRCAEELKPTDCLCVLIKQQQ